MSLHALTTLALAIAKGINSLCDDHAPPRGEPDVFYSLAAVVPEGIETWMRQHPDSCGVITALELLKKHQLLSAAHKLADSAKRMQARNPDCIVMVFNLEVV